jgi:hypothetical protein
MAKKVLAQQDLVIQTSITTPATGFFGFGAKSDGLYQRTSAGVELRLLSTGDTGTFATLATPVFTTNITTPLILGGSTVSGDITISSTSNATKGRILFGTTAAYNEELKYFGIGTPTPVVTLHATSTTEAVYARLQGISDTDNYSALELWSSTGSKKWQFALKSFTGEEGDFAFSHWTGSAWINPLRIKTNTGNIGIGVNLATAAMHFKAGKAIAGTAPIKLTTGTLLSTTEAGAIEMAAGHLYFTAVDGGTRFQLDQQAGSGSGITRSISNISGTTTGGAVASTDYVYFMTTTFTYTQPTAVGNSNRYTLKNSGTGIITIVFTSGQTADGSTSINLAADNSIDIISNNTNWLII